MLKKLSNFIAIAIIIIGNPATISPNTDNVQAIKRLKKCLYIIRINDYKTYFLNGGINLIQQLVRKESIKNRIENTITPMAAGI